MQTVSGSLCQEWASFTLSWKAQVSETSYTYGPYELLPENFCRNPDGESGPWCFTTNASLPKDWEYCDIPVCPFPSPPPSPDAPPAAPPGLCTDTCNGQVGGAQVGICDDGVGRRDGVAGICEPGTDCSDCGVREFASPLFGVPDACYQRALSGVADACLQSMLDNGVCDAGCNTADCGFDGFDRATGHFGDCGRAKIEESCVHAMEDSSRDYTSLPAQVNVSMDLGRFDLLVGSEGLLKLGFRLDVSMQWSSPNVQKTECGYALPHLLSVTKNEISISDRHRAIERYAQTLLFLPTPVIAGQLAGVHWPHSIVESDYSARYEENSVVYNETLDFQLGLRKTYKYFPFDQHDLELDISVPGVPLFGCDRIVEALRDKAGDGLENLLPLDQTWLPAMSLGKSLPEQLITRTDTHLVGSCRIRIRVRRNFNTFFFKKILVLVMIVQAALCSLRLNPLAPPLVGARFAIQITAMLVISVRSQEDLDDEIGRNTQLLWLDQFMFGQFAAVLSALVESALVHHLIRGGNDTFALLLDGIFRVLLPMLMYPACVIGYVAGALTASDTVTFTICLCGILLPLTWGVLQVRRTFVRFQNSKTRLAAQLIDADESEIDDKSESSLLREAFRLFDLDKSGDIDANEVRSMLSTMFPLMPIQHRKVALELQSNPNPNPNPSP